MKIILAEKKINAYEDIKGDNFFILFFGSVISG